jgi:hypothetical protein
MKIYFNQKKFISQSLIVIGIVILLTTAGIVLAQGELGDTYLPLALREGETPTSTPTTLPTPTPTPTGTLPAEYIIIGWNDLGMHCYDRDYADMGVLPPYNNIWAQVIHRGDPPQIVTEGITVSYSIQDNTYSVGKTNFWSYAEALFGQALPPNIGLTGKGLAGVMDHIGNHYVAEGGVPITEFRDSSPSTPYYFQLADLVVKDNLLMQFLVQQQLLYLHQARCAVTHAIMNPIPISGGISYHCTMKKKALT